MGDSMGKAITLPPPLPSISSSSESEPEDLQLIEHAPPFWRNPRGKMLWKQLSMCEKPRDTAWEKRRRQILQQERKRNVVDAVKLTDEDLNELKGSIELGFGFNEEQGQNLCNTLPALDLYFAVNRQLSTSPVLSPSTTSPPPLHPNTNNKGGLGTGGATSTTSFSSSSVGVSSSSSFGERSSSGSPVSDSSDTWKILNPGDAPEQVKTKLRHWAQAVACSVIQSQ